MESKEFAFKIAKLCEDKKASDIEVIDIIKFGKIADYYIICSGESEAQLKAISKYIEESISDDLDLEPRVKEGKYGDKWFLLDYIDVVVHVIGSEAREFYNLEELWQAGKFLSPNEWSSEMLKNNDS
jgi:ribosome-associated protein